MSFTSTHKEAIHAALTAWFPGDRAVAEMPDDMLAVYGSDMEAAIRAYLEARGAKIVPAEQSKEWSEKYCDLTNRLPDGMQSTSSHDGWVHTTFREMAGREISAMLSASPDLFTDEVRA